MSSQNPVPGRRLRFGVNYVPSKRWYYCWNDWNSSEIAADFDAIDALGADHLRVMVLWPYFQPNPSKVSPGHLRRLGELMDLALERNLDVFLCPLTGWLSGFRFLPPWVNAPEDIFLNDEVFACETRYLQALMDVASGRSNFLGFDLGNEINVLVSALPTDSGDAWGKRITGWLRERLAGKWVVNGVDHQPWFNGRTFSARHLVGEYDAATVHAWPMFTGSLLRGGLADKPARHLSAFLTHLCRSEMVRAGCDKPVWIQEFGCSRLWGSEQEQLAYMESSVRLAIQAGATWFTWWCSHDIDSSFQFNPLEYDLGLLTVDNNRKPLADVFARLAGEYATALAPEPDALFSFPENFIPRLTGETPPGQWLEQNLLTSTWEEFDRYLSGKE